GESLHKAIDEFNQAVAKDPNFALGYAGLADTYAVLSYYADVPPQESFPLGLKAARRAIEIDPSLAEPHAALAWIKGVYEWDWAGSEREFREAIRLNPDWPTAHAWFGLILTGRGRYQEGRQQTSEALRLAPHSPLMNALHGLTLYLAHDFEATERQLKVALDLEPNYAFARELYGGAMFQQGRVADAIAELREASRLGGGTAALKGGLGRACAMGGERAEAEKILEELKQLATTNLAVGHYIAVIYMGLGDKPQAMEWLEKGIAAKAYRAFQLKVDPAFDGLHSEERFQRLLKQIGLD
ncbi:MAG: tetratricopeptide repeat protein, partial [Verrucomicrobia bacterium]|nr:tetratricopeptide repeat protein [Verrucomicrobiota bacterium]